MRISQLSRVWLGAALGINPDRLTGLTSTPVGAGQMADTYRIEYSVDGEVRQSLVLKLTPDNDRSVAIGQSEKNYQREVGFYRVFADRLGVRTPRCLHAEVDDDGIEFALLLEDLSPCRPGDQLAGCSLEEAEMVVRELAKLHGPMWGDPLLESYEWLPGPRVLTPELNAVRPAAFDTFCERFDGLIEAEILEVGRKLFSSGRFFDVQHECVGTIQHGDFRPDNLIFEVVGGKEAVAVVDWQTVQRGPGALDLAFFLGAALAPEDRRASEKSLIEIYHQDLLSYGVPDYSLDDCRRDYATFALYQYVVGVGAALTVKQTDRGDRLFVSMVRRAGQHALDLDSIGHLSA